MRLNKEEKNAIYYALNYWANYIETGQINCSAKDAEKTRQKDLLRALDVEQMKKVISLRELAIKILGAY